MTAPLAIPGAMDQRSDTPLKRSRSQALQVVQRISGDLAKTSVECDDSVEMDHVRGCKRFLSESMAADMSRMSCGNAFLFGTSPESGVPGGDSPSCTPMTTDRLCMATSPQGHQPFNPFASPNGRCSRPCGSDASSPTMQLDDCPMSSSPSGCSSQEVTMATPQPSSLPMTPPRNSLYTTERVTGFATPMPTRMRHVRSDACNGTMDASEAERLPPSPSDPALAQDLRRTALLRSCLQRSEDRPAATVHARFQPHLPRVASVGKFIDKPMETDQQRRQLKLAADLDAASLGATTSHGASHPRPPPNLQLVQPHLQSSFMGRAQFRLPPSGLLPQFEGPSTHPQHQPAAEPLSVSQPQLQSHQQGFEEQGVYSGGGASGSPPPMSCGSMSNSMDASVADGDPCDISDQEADGSDSHSRRINRSTSVSSLHVRAQHGFGNSGSALGLYAPGGVFAFCEDDFPPASLPGFQRG